jgi:hypothetical protein
VSVRTVDGPRHGRVNDSHTNTLYAELPAASIAARGHWV